MYCRNISFLTIALFAMLALLCCAGCRKSPRYTSAANTHAVESAQGYIVNVPDDWEDQHSMSGIFDVVYKRPIANDTEIFCENMNVGVEPLKRKASLAEYFNANITTMKSVMSGFREVSSTDFHGNLPGKKLVYTWEYSKLSLKVCTYFFLQRNNGYIITCTATTDSFAKYEPTFDDIGRSFRLK